MVEIKRAWITINGGMLTTIPLPDDIKPFPSRVEMEVFRKEWTDKIRIGVISGLVAVGVPQAEASEKTIELKFKLKEG